MMDTQSVGGYGSTKVGAGSDPAPAQTSDPGGMRFWAHNPKEKKRKNLRVARWHVTCGLQGNALPRHRVAAVPGTSSELREAMRSRPGVYGFTIRFGRAVLEAGALRTVLCAA